MFHLPSLKSIFHEAITVSPLSQLVTQSIIELQKKYQLIKNTQTPYIFIQGVLSAVEQGKMLEKALRQGNTNQFVLPMIQKYIMILDKVVDTTESQALGAASPLSQLINKLEAMVKLP